MSNFGTDYQGLAHEWMYNRDELYDGYCYGNRMYARGLTIYSYGSHYILAQWVKNKAGALVLLVNSYGSSNTTMKQKRCIENAIPSHIVVFNVPEGRLNHEKNIESYIDQIKSLITLASRAKSKKEEYEDQANIIRHELELYLKHFKPKYKLSKEERVLIENTLSSEDLDLLNKAQKKREKLERDKKARKNKEAVDKEKANLELWKSGELGRIYLSYDSKSYLRIVDDKIETSGSVKVSIDNAKILYLAYKSGRDISGKHLEHYTVEYANDKEFKIGCHTIPFSEVERISKQLNW